jgi:transcriptional regulator GlxA family with amidase domain
MSGRLFRVQDWEAMARLAKFRPCGMAALCSISLRQLERHFVCHLRNRPGNWCRELRLRLAQKLISQGWSDKAVAAELGFADSAHLCRDFKKRCGMTPQDYAPFHVLAQSSEPHRQFGENILCARVERRFL